MLNLLYVGEGIELASKGYIGPLIDIDTANPFYHRYKNYNWSDLKALATRYKQITIRMPTSEEKIKYKQMAQEISDRHQNLKIALNPLDKPVTKD